MLCAIGSRCKLDLEKIVDQLFCIVTVLIIFCICITISMSTFINSDLVFQVFTFFVLPRGEGWKKNAQWFKISHKVAIGVLNFPSSYRLIFKILYFFYFQFQKYWHHSKKITKSRMMGKVKNVNQQNKACIQQTSVLKLF